LASSKLEKIAPLSCTYLDFKDFKKINSEILEISEVHFIISRVLAGIAILLVCWSYSNVLSQHYLPHPRQ